jgi:CRP/FNR family cyclic AMP-dependent transcriptional regulator
MIPRSPFQDEAREPRGGADPATRRPWRHSLAPRNTPARFRSGFESLRGMDLFSPVSDGELVKFAALGCERRVEKGTAFRMSDACRAEDGTPPLALILEGEAVLAWGRGAEELLIRALEPGDLLGEIEVFDGAIGEWAAPGTVTRTLTTLRLLEWDRDDVLEALRRWPDVALSLLGGMARRQRELHRRVAGICHQRAPRRLARALMAVIEDRGVRHRDEDGRPCLLLRRAPSRTRLAEIAGMARETVSRLLTQWEQGGWIAGDQGDLLVLDEPQLRRLAGLEIP